MSSTILPTTSASIQSIIKQFDTNKDGQFSADEFSNFLNAFVKAMAGTNTTATTKTTATSSAAVTSALLATTTGSTSSSSDSLPDCPPGWNQQKWVDSSHTTIKYVAGRIMARYSPSDWVDETKREQILSDFRTAGLNPTASGKDCCDFGDGAGPIDLVQAASQGGKAWQWIAAA
jgi:hypothetical protein